jgi:hypothetical protein
MPKKASKAKPGKAAKGSPAKRQAKKTESDADCREEAHFVETLEANKQLAREPGALPPGATHQVERDEAGNERVVRKRFSAF